jgi:signal transduction histidine kinase
MVGAMQDVTQEKEQEYRIEKAIVDAQEKERHEIGMELHDNVTQILGASLLYLGMAKDKKMKKKSDLNPVEQSSQYISDAITEIRKLSHQLAPASFEGVSLKEVFESFIAVVNTQCKFDVHFHFDENVHSHFNEFDINKINANIQINLYRILQEQMNNIIKYSGATNVEVSITLSDTIVTLRIADNGRGFDPALVKEGIGLENIRRRAKLYSGKFMLNSSPGNGCEIIVEMLM